MDVEIYEIREFPFSLGIIIFIEGQFSYHCVNIHFCVAFSTVDEKASYIVTRFAKASLKLHVPYLQMKAAYRALDTFCELPDETRAKYERVSPNNHGYIKPGKEK